MENGLFKSDISDPFVKKLMNIVTESVIFNADHFSSLDKISELLNDGYDIDGKEINPMLLGQVLELLVTKSKALDTRVYNTLAGETNNYNVTQAVREIMHDGGFTRMLKGGRGGFYRKYAFGDFFFIVKANPQTGMPEFSEISLKNVFVDSSGTDFLNKGGNKVSSTCFVFEYPWDLAVSDFPGIEDVATKGRLPFGNKNNLLGEDLDLNPQQKMYREKNLVEIAMGFDISDITNPKQIMFAGPGASIIPDSLKEGKDYEHYLGKYGKNNYNPYIPAMQLKCKVQGDGIFNRGFGHLLYKITKILAKMQTKFIRYTDKNFEPTVVYNIPYRKGQNMAKKLEDADLQRANGKSPIVVNEFVSTDQSKSVSMDTLMTQPMSQDYERLREDINREVRRYGLNVDLYYTDAAKTATAITVEEMGQNAAIQGLHEVDTETYEAATAYAIDIFKKNIKVSDKTPFKFKPKIIMQDGTEMTVENRPFTRGDLKQVLEKYDFNVQTDSRTGSYPSQLFEDKLRSQYINSLLTVGEVDTAKQLLQDGASSFGLSFNIMKKVPPTGQPQQGQPQQGQPGATPSAGTLANTGGKQQVQDMLQNQASYTSPLIGK